MMTGTNRNNIKTLSGIAHLRQSIIDILTTPVGSRVMRREYGSRIFDLVDKPGNKTAVIEVFSAVAEALERWEPRFRLSRVIDNGVTADGKINIDVQGEYLPDGKQITLKGIVL